MSNMELTIKNFHEEKDRIIEESYNQRKSIINDLGDEIKTLKK